jgi:hypothetical protein
MDEADPPLETSPQSLRHHVRKSIPGTINSLIRFPPADTNLLTGPLQLGVDALFVHGSAVAFFQSPHRLDDDMPLLGDILTKTTPFVGFSLVGSYLLLAATSTEDPC